MSPATSHTFPLAMLAALGALSVGAVFALPAAADPASREDPINGYSEMIEDPGPNPYIPDNWREDGPIDPAEIERGEAEMLDLLAQPAPPPPESFSAWFRRLDSGDKQRLLAFMAERGITDEDGNRLTEQEFAVYLPFFDSELRKEAKTDEQRAAAFLQIQKETGILPDISDADLDGFGDFGVTGASGPRSDIDPGR